MYVRLFLSCRVELILYLDLFSWKTEKSEKLSNPYRLKLADEPISTKVTKRALASVTEAIKETYLRMSMGCALPDFNYLEKQLRAGKDFFVAP